MTNNYALVAAGLAAVIPDGTYKKMIACLGGISSPRDWKKGETDADTLERLRVLAAKLRAQLDASKVQQE